MRRRETLSVTGNFPAEGQDSNRMGVIPVWGFADVVESKADGIPVGDRIYGYFPYNPFKNDSNQSTRTTLF